VFVQKNMSRRRLTVAAVMGFAVLGSAAINQGASAPVASTLSSTTAHTAAAKACPDATTLVTTAHTANCEPTNQPETFADLASKANSYASRSTAPFSSVAPGAYMAALKQTAALVGPGGMPGSGQTWAPYGTAPLCAHQSTGGTSPCPAAGPDNGTYSNVGGLGFVTLSGRVTSFAYDPSIAGRFFASPTAGGVFESLDGGSTWHSIGDGLPTQVVGAIAYDVPLHRLLVGSGDNSFGGDGISGHGFFTSDNGGGAWSMSTGFPDLATTFKVVVSPADITGNTVYVASSKGLFKSSNGGNSFVNENLPTTPAGYSPNCAGDTTTPLCFFANIVTDVVVKGAITSANAAAGSVMAVVGWRAGQRADTQGSCTLNGNPTPCLQAPQNGIYLSSAPGTAGNPGSFVFQNEGSGSASMHGFAVNQKVGRTALGEAHGAGQNQDAVYALVEDALKFQGCPDVLDTGKQVPCSGATGTGTGLALATYLDGMYASYDFGRSWTKIMDYTQTKYLHTNSALVGQAGYSPGIQSWYNLYVEPDPSFHDIYGNPQRVVFGLEEIWENNQQDPFQLAGQPNSILHDPWQAHQTQSVATDPWVVIGRYWNACAALNTGVPCNFNAQNPPPLGAITTTHPDQHAALFVPDGQGGVTLFAGSDGGVFKQHVGPGVDFNNNNWGDGNNLGLYSLQPYDAEVANDGTVVAGNQDNGEMKMRPGAYAAEIYGGDGFFTTIDPANSNNIIEEYTYGAASVTNDGGTTWNSVPTTSDITGTNADCGGPSTNLFATPIEQDPTMGHHVVIGCQKINESVDAYNSAGTWVAVYDLGTYTPPGGSKAIPNIPSAVGVRDANMYVGYCGYCDVVTGGLPFHSGLATNVGGSAPPAIGTSNGWHMASAFCSGCGTTNGLLPQRYITSTQIDPIDPNTVYVTLGGYGRRWIPPGALGDATANVGTGHIFKSTDHGEHFTDITGNLPDLPANWTLVHAGNLVVATDAGVFESTGTGGTTWGVVGTGLPNTPVFTLRINPTNPDLMVVATYGRGVYQYGFTTLAAAVPESWLVPLLPLMAVPLVGLVLWRRRQRATVLGTQPG